MIDQISKLYNVSTEIGFEEIFIAMLVSMLLGYMLSQIYKLYYGPNEPADQSIGASFLLMMPAVTSIFIIIQYSLPLSLGLLGALSFVRFRTPVKRAEDISFILLAISISLCCAVRYYHIALFLIIIIAAYASAKRFFPKYKFFENGSTLVTVHGEEIIEFEPVGEALVSNNFGKPIMVSSQSADNYHTIVFSVRGKNATKHSELTKTLRSCLDERVRVDVFYPGNELTA